MHKTKKAEQKVKKHFERFALFRGKSPL